MPTKAKTAQRDTASYFLLFAEGVYINRYHLEAIVREANGLIVIYTVSGARIRVDEDSLTPQGVRMLGGDA